MMGKGKLTRKRVNRQGRQPGQKNLAGPSFVKECARQTKARIGAQRCWQACPQRLVARSFAVRSSMSSSSGAPGTRFSAGAGCG